MKLLLRPDNEDEAQAVDDLRKTVYKEGFGGMGFGYIAGYASCVLYERFTKKIRPTTKFAAPLVSASVLGAIAASTAMRNNYHVLQYATYVRKSKEEKQGN